MGIVLKEGINDGNQQPVLLDSEFQPEKMDAAMSLELDPKGDPGISEYQIHNI